LGSVDVPEVASTDLVQEDDVVVVEFPSLPRDGFVEYGTGAARDREPAVELVKN
jgi:hypothetical protein